MTDEQRMYLVRQLADLHRLGADLTWRTAAALLDSGTPADDLADAFGMSRSAFYRHVRVWREANGGQPPVPPQTV